jgi:hypothetical protein
VKAAGLEDRGHQGQRAYRQCQRRGQAQQHRELRRLALDLGRLVIFANVDVAADLRKDRGADLRRQSLRAEAG